MKLSLEQKFENFHLFNKRSGFSVELAKLYYMEGHREALEETEETIAILEGENQQLRKEIK